MLKRNCALSPRQLALFYATLVALSFLIGTGFALSGAWLVLPFAGIEMLVLGLALLKYGQSALDREHIVLDREALCVEVVQAGCRRRERFNPHWVRIEAEGSVGARPLRVWLGEGGRRVAVGQFVGEVQRAVFVQELNHALASVRSSGVQGVPQFGSSTS